MLYKALYKINEYWGEDRMTKPADHKFSIAYISKYSGDISTVEVALSVGEEKMKVLIQPNEKNNIEEDLPEIIKQIEKSQLSRMGIGILNDCEVYVHNQEEGGQTKKVEFADENFTLFK